MSLDSSEFVYEYVSVNREVLLEDRDGKILTSDLSLSINGEHSTVPEVPTCAALPNKVVQGQQSEGPSDNII